MAKSPFTFFAAAAAAAKIKENILHHLSLIEREGNLFDLWLCFPSLPLSLSLSACLILIPVAAAAAAAAAVLIFYNPAHPRTRTCS